MIQIKKRNSHNLNEDEKQKQMRTSLFYAAKTKIKKLLHLTKRKMKMIILRINELFACECM